RPGSGRREEKHHSKEPLVCGIGRPLYAHASNVLGLTGWVHWLDEIVRSIPIVAENSGATRRKFMSNISASVIIATHNRPEKLAETLSSLTRQDNEACEYEIIVVDDGSKPPVVIDRGDEYPPAILVRVEGLERSAARSRGAAVARGELLIFIDDDISVKPDFVAAHVRAHQDWPGVLAVGAISLPDEAITTPFGRFRQRLEQHEVPLARGLTATRNFCTAANMSISRDVFL